MRHVLVPALLLFSSFAFANDCKFTAERHVQIDPAGLRALRAELGSSDLTVEGVPGLAHVEVTGKACASDQAWLAELDITQSRQGDKAVIKPAPHASHDGLGNNYAYIDFSVRMPTNLTLDVDSGSGDSLVTNVAALEFSSGSGDLHVDHVAGAMTANVGSGDVVASNLGSFTLRSSGSGDMQLSQVQGDVKIGHVGSGDVQISTTRGAVHIDEIGSGDVSANDIGGDVVVGSIGSGDVDAKNVKGGLTVRSAGSGEVHHSGIVGKIDVPKKHEDD